MIVIGAFLAVILGVIVNAFIPGDKIAPEVALTWIGLPGDLFLRAITCAVLPLISSLIILGASSIISGSASASTDSPSTSSAPQTGDETIRRAELNKKARKLVGKTLSLYLFTTFLAVCEGMAVGQLLALTYKTVDFESSSGSRLSSNGKPQSNTDI